MTGAAPTSCMCRPIVPGKANIAVTVYGSRETHALLKGPIAPAAPPMPPRSRKNADGSVDICLGPKAPEGMETNWVPTIPPAASSS